MKLVILGASGGCGRHLVEQSLTRGFPITAVGRATSDLQHVPEALRARGELDDPVFLASILDGADVLLVAVGLVVSGLSPFAAIEDPTLLSRCGPVIARAASAAGVRRILAITAGGVGDSYAMMPAAFRAILALTSMRKVYPELERFEDALFASSVEVCCVRPTGLTDEPATGRAVVAKALVGRASIPRADVAAFLLDHLEGPLPAAGPVITVTGAA